MRLIKIFKIKVDVPEIVFTIGFGEHRQNEWYYKLLCADATAERMLYNTPLRQNMDKIFIRNLEIGTIISVFNRKRQIPQKLYFDIETATDVRLSIFLMLY